MMKKYDRKHIEKLMDYLLSSRDFKTLKTNYQDSIKKFPESIMLKRTYGRRLETLKKDPESLVVIKEVVSDYLFHISKNPDDYEIKYDLALYYHHTIKDYEKAIEIYKSLIDKRYNFHDYQNIYLLYFKLHLCYSFLKNNESAIKSLKQSNIILTEMLNENYDLELKQCIDYNYKSIRHIHSVNNNKKLINNDLKHPKP